MHPAWARYLGNIFQEYITKMNNMLTQKTSYLTLIQGNIRKPLGLRESAGFRPRKVFIIMKNIFSLEPKKQKEREEGRTETDFF